jgi:hypothetical protein
LVWHVYAGDSTLSGANETQNCRHHLVQRHRCADLVIGHPAQQRLNGLEVIKDAAEFLRCLAERVAGPARQKEPPAVKGAIAPPAVPPEEAPTPAAELTISLEPFESNSPLEAPTPAADLTIRLELDEHLSRLTHHAGSHEPAAI